MEKIMKSNWLDTKEYPFESKYIDINGAAMHYIDEGQGPTLLFIHGTPTWSFDFRNIIKSLSADFRCVAFDHIGFGLSEKPPNYNYSTKQHAENLEILLDKLNISSFTMIVHDFGGPIGLSYAISNPHKINKFVIFNTWLWSSKGDPSYKKLSKILNSPILPFLYLNLNFSAKFLLPNSYRKQKPRKEILKHYTKPLNSRSNRRGTLAFAKSLRNDQDWFEYLWSQVAIIAEKPSLFLWGMKDSFIGEKYLKRFESTFVNSQTLKLENSGHFPQEEESQTVINAMDKFLIPDKHSISPSYSKV